MTAARSSEARRVAARLAGFALAVTVALAALAAAATVAGLNGAAAPTDYRELVLDRPFCYAVVDLERGVPLFLGTFERP